MGGFGAVISRWLWAQSTSWTGVDIRRHSRILRPHARLSACSQRAMRHAARAREPTPIWASAMEVTSRPRLSNWGSMGSRRKSGPTWEGSLRNSGRRSDCHRSCRLPVWPLASPALAPPVPRTTAPSVLRRRRAGRGPSPEGPVTAVDADQAAAAGRAGKQRECGGASGVAARGRGMRHPQPTGE